MSESSGDVVLRDRTQLERVWQLADATLRANSGEVADLAWATMEALAWAWGGFPTAPITGRTLSSPSAAELRAELGAIVERTAAARTRAQYARLQGSAEALSFALSEPGPFWWSSLDDAITPAERGDLATPSGGTAAAR